MLEPESKAPVVDFLATIEGLKVFFYLLCVRSVTQAAVHYCKVVFPLLRRVEFATPDKFFAELEGDASNLCCWSGELYLELHNGTYTTQAQVR